MVGGGRGADGGDGERKERNYMCYMSDDEQIEVRAGLTCVV
jgi:hypothetical protein